MRDRIISEKNNKRRGSDHKYSRDDGGGLNRDTELITGRNAVTEALKSERPLNKVFLQNPASDGPLRVIEAMARGRGIPVVRVEKAWLDKTSERPHQGAAASVSVKEYCDVQDILEYSAERGEKPLLVITNGIFDTHNLGAIIRSAETAGAHGVVVPKRNAAGLTGAVARTSAGAIEYMRVARVANIAAVIRDLKKQGIWIIGADASATMNYTDCDMSGAAAIVIGGEDGGLGRLVAESCDFVVKLPVRGNIASLNASAAAAVMLYEALRQRGLTSPAHDGTYRGDMAPRDDITEGDEKPALESVENE